MATVPTTPPDVRRITVADVRYGDQIIRCGDVVRVVTVPAADDERVPRIRFDWEDVRQVEGRPASTGMSMLLATEPITLVYRPAGGEA